MSGKLISTSAPKSCNSQEIDCSPAAVVRDSKGRGGSEDVLRECASEEISDYYQVTIEWINHKEKIAYRALGVRNCGLHPLI